MRATGQTHRGFSGDAGAHGAHAIRVTYPNECAFSQPPRNHDVALTTATRLELEAVNRQINRSIIPKRDERRGGIEAWLLYPESGDCNDYAVTKRHELYARGWPAKALLLAEVELTSSGEHHLVLVARTREADLVLDNFRPSVRVWTDTLSDFRWIRIQSPDNPKSWS
jgi:predicted transglutaminase-like cysteine proteinase